MRIVTEFRLLLLLLPLASVSFSPRSTTKEEIDWASRIDIDDKCNAWKLCAVRDCVQFLVKNSSSSPYFGRNSTLSAAAAAGGDGDGQQGGLLRDKDRVDRGCMAGFSIVIPLRSREARASSSSSSSPV